MSRFSEDGPLLTGRFVVDSVWNDGRRFSARKGECGMEEIVQTTPWDDHPAERPVFPGASPDALKNVMARACEAAGIVHATHDDLRHRYASVKIAERVPVTMLAVQLGHSKKSLTLDTYSHVLING